MKAIWVVILSIVFISACNVSPEEINYNEDECSYCKMKISDHRFGAELVTVKGKVYKYDSAECLFHTLAEKQKEDYKYILVTDFLEPGKLINGKDAVYLIGPNRPSPMGGDLSAYNNNESATAEIEKVGGEIYDFQELLDKYID